VIYYEYEQQFYLVFYPMFRSHDRNCSNDRKDRMVHDMRTGQKGITRRNLKIIWGILYGCETLSLA
jgi:lysine/ornithine N-monooxygenase